MGQECSSRPFDPPMVAGRQITWWNGSQRSSTQSQVDLVVPAGPPAGAGRLRRPRGQHRRVPVHRPHHAALPSHRHRGDQTWAARTDSNGLPFVSGAARIGDLIVGITVLHPSADQAAQVSDLTTLLTAAVADLRASGLPAADGRMTGTLHLGEPRTSVLPARGERDTCRASALLWGGGPVQQNIPLLAPATLNR